MSPENIRPIVTALNKSSNFLIVLPPNASGDNIAAGLALRSFLRKLDKETTVVGVGLRDQKYSFLEGFDQIFSKLNVTKNFVIRVATKDAPLDELSYKKEADELLIFLKPKQGELKPTDIKFNASDFPYDLIVTIGIKSLDQLGEFYSSNADLFFNVPVLNIDFKSSNESYGQYNLVELNSTSVSEIVMDLINEYEANMLDETIATSLLTGIISETNSFQHTRTAPQTFLKASQLITSGAKQQEIVASLYRSKTLSFLKLWGRALARVVQDSKLGLVYTIVTQNDFQKSGASEAEAEQIIPEMAVQLKLGKIFVVLRELNPTTTQVFAQLPTTVDPALIFGGFSPITVAPSTVKFTVELPVTEAESKIIGQIKQEWTRLAA